MDDEGSKIGSLESVYIDTASEEAVFATVKVGMVGGHRVPLAGATVAPQAPPSALGEKLVKDAPSIGTDGELAAAEKPAIVEHYGLSYQPGAAGGRRLGRR